MPSKLERFVGGAAKAASEGFVAKYKNDLAMKRDKLLHGQTMERDEQQHTNRMAQLEVGRTHDAAMIDLRHEKDMEKVQAVHDMGANERRLRAKELEGKIENQELVNAVNKLSLEDEQEKRQLLTIMSSPNVSPEERELAKELYYIRTSKTDRNKYKAVQSRDEWGGYTDDWVLFNQQSGEVQALGQPKDWPKAATTAPPASTTRSIRLTQEQVNAMTTKQQVMDARRKGWVTPQQAQEWARRNAEAK